MAKGEATKPTAAELAILSVLWGAGPSTVRDVQNQLHSVRGTGYTTTLKLMQIMYEKGLLKRDESNRSHIYSAAVTRHKTQKIAVNKMIDQFFEGSAQQLVMQALAYTKSTSEELAEIRKLLDSLDGKES